MEEHRGALWAKPKVTHTTSAHIPWEEPSHKMMPNSKIAQKM